MRADGAIIADDRFGADDTVRTESHACPDPSGWVHQGGGVAIAPLRETLWLAVEIGQQYGHAHRDRRHGEGAAERIAIAEHLLRYAALLAEDGRSCPRGSRELRSVGCIDEARAGGIVGVAAVRG